MASPVASRVSIKIPETPSARLRRVRPRRGAVARGRVQSGPAAAGPGSGPMIGSARIQDPGSAAKAGIQREPTTQTREWRGGGWSAPRRQGCTALGPCRFRGASRPLQGPAGALPELQDRGLAGAAVQATVGPREAAPPSWPQSHWPHCSCTRVEEYSKHQNHNNQCDSHNQFLQLDLNLL